MLRSLLIGSALAAVLAGGAPAIVFAQPPSPPRPPDVVGKVERGVRRAVTNTDRAVRRAPHRSRRAVRHTTHRVTRTVRVMCNDGRIHIGRTRTTACFGHGGYRG